MAKLNHSEILSFKGYNVHVPNFSKLVCGIFYMHSVCAVKFFIQNTLNCNRFYRWLIFCLIFYTQHLLSPEEYTPPKKMIEFSRKHQEEEMVQTLKEEIQQLTTDEADLEVGFIGYTTQLKDMWLVNIKQRDLDKTYMHAIFMLIGILVLYS